MICPECYDDDYAYNILKETGMYLFNCPKCGRAYTIRRAPDEDETPQGVTE